MSTPETTPIQPEVSEATTGKYKPARRFYGRPPVSEAQAMVFARLAPLHQKMEWKDTEFARQITRLLRRLVDREENAKIIVRKWDCLPRAWLTKPHSIDEAVAKANLTADELCRLVFIALKEETQEKVDVMRIAAMPDLVAASLEAAKKQGPAAASERTKHLQRTGFLPARGQGMPQKEPKHSKPATGSGGEDANIEPTSFDEQLAELDAIEADTEVDIFANGDSDE